MRVGVFRRFASFFLDAMPILLVLGLLLNLFVGDILKSQYPNYDEIAATYQENINDYYLTLDQYLLDLNEETITQEQYDTMIVDLRDTFTLNNEYHESVILANYYSIFIYFLVSYVLISYFYNLITKGQTYGRKIMKLELVGKVNWFSLILREVLWKTLFWVFTLSIGIWVDIALITFTRKKRTFRDMLSETQVVFQGTSYPF